MQKKIVPFIIAIVLVIGFFWQYFAKGYIPIPASFMVAWYEPWKGEFSKNGVPTIPHKPVGDDIFRQIYPLRTLANDLLMRGRLPLWNPYNGSGQPLLATLHTGITNPFSLLGFLGKHGWAWFIMLQLPLLFLSMFWYVKTLRVSEYGAILSGIVLSLSGVATARYIYGDYMYALITLPLLLGCIERRMHKGIPLLTALLLVSVQPQISAYIVVTVLLYTSTRTPNVWRHVFLALCLGLGISAFQLIPTLELYAHANVTSASSAFIFQKFLMPIPHLISFVIPNFFGNSGTYNYWGRIDYVETVVSVGMLPIVLALCSTNKTQARFFLWGTVTTLLLTLDWFLPKLLYGLPLPVVSTSIPTRIYLLTTFFVAVLAGIGVDTKPRRSVLVLMLLLGIFFVGVARFFPCSSHIPDCTRIALRNGLFEIAVFTVGAVSLVIRSAFVGKALLLLMLLSAGLYNGWKFLPMSPSSYVGMPHEVLTTMKQLAPMRVATPFATDFATQYRYFDSNYYDPLYIKRYGELISYVNTGDRQRGLTRSDVNVVSDASVSAALSFRRERYWDMSGTAALVVKKAEISSSSAMSVWEDTTWQIISRPTAMPRAYLVSSITVESDPQKTLARMFSPDTDLSKTAFVDMPIRRISEAINPQEGKVTIDQYDTEVIMLSGEAVQDSFLVLSDTYYPGWKASIDGNEVPIYRTNYTFRGVVMPQGKHTIMFRYDPESFWIGVWISIVSFLVWGFLYISRKK